VTILYRFIHNGDADAPAEQFRMTSVSSRDADATSSPVELNLERHRRRRHSTADDTAAPDVEVLRRGGGGRRRSHHQATVEFRD